MTIFLSLVYAFCLFPILVGELDVNFTFLIVTLALILFRREIQLPSKWIIGCLIFYLLSFFPTIFVFEDYAFVLERRVLSLLSFLAMFAFCFVNFDEKHQKAFEWGVILFVLYTALNACILYILILLEFIPGVTFKEYVGSQRGGAVLILGVWIALNKFLSEETSRRKQLVYGGIFSIAVLGLFLSFSRAIILGFLVSFLVFFICIASKSRRHKFLDRQTLLALPLRLRHLIPLAVFVFLISSVFQDAVFQTMSSFIGNLYSGQVLKAVTTYQDSSEGKRVAIWLEIVAYVLSDVRHFLFGSGHTGYWYASGLHAGSAHSQFFDVLLRVGVIGTAVYLFILARIGAVFYVTRSSWLWPFVGILVYSVFHESFKEPSGTFVLACFVAMTAYPRLGRKYE